MTPELAQLSRTVDPAKLGERIRSARLAAGLTQQQAADGAVSAAYISRIEIGNRRPDTRLLEHLALRLHTTVEALVLDVRRDDVAEAELALDYAELALKSGDTEAALLQIEGLLTRARADATAGDTAAGAAGVLAGDALPHGDDLRARAAFLHAQALEAAGRYDDAITRLRQLAATADHDARWLRILTALSRCYRETGELDRAIDAGQQALDEIEPPLSETDEAIQLALTIAAAHYERGDVHQAHRLCQETIAKAERLASPTARASAYWNASLIQTRQGAVAAALPLARKAVEILERGEDARNLARLKGALATIQLRLDPPDLDGAHTSATEALREMAWTDASELDKARVQLTTAKIDYLSGRYEQAQHTATECARIAADHNPLLAAEAHLVLGRTHLAQGETRHAHDSFQHAVMTLTAIGADRKAAETWFELGTLLQQLGDEHTALDAYRRAAASTGINQPTGLNLPTPTTT